MRSFRGFRQDSRFLPDRWQTGGGKLFFSPSFVAMGVGADMHDLRYQKCPNPNLDKPAAVGAQASDCDGVVHGHYRDEHQCPKYDQD